MSRPSVSVVMPFSGDVTTARTAADALRSLEAKPGDELILVDNSRAGLQSELSGVSVIRASGEASPAHARNAGAGNASNEWILFLDADTIPRRDLLEAYFEHQPSGEVGALAGEVVAAPAGPTLAERYGASRSFLSQQAHLEHPYRPRAAAANLLVRRSAFEQVGGFYEGVRAGEDTDFTWRLQDAGWRLELRPEAWVEHRYRTTVSELRKQWRGYAAGRAWLARRHDGFRPEPAVARAARRGVGRVRRRSAAPRTRRPSQPPPLERGRYLALDVLLSLDELAGLMLSNRPARDHRPSSPDQLHQRGASVVTVADQFPARGDPLVELAAALENARVEAMARPETVDAEASRTLHIDYLEDDGLAARAIATSALLLRHPLRSAQDAARRRPGEPGLTALAPAVRRLERDADARVLALGGERPEAIARRLAQLAGRPADELEKR
jgi:GT2 family glycosyltransferase